MVSAVTQVDRKPLIIYVHFQTKLWLFDRASGLLHCYKMLQFHDVLRKGSEKKGEQLFCHFMSLLAVTFMSITKGRFIMYSN